MGYSGSATVEIEIERMRHKVTGELFMMDSVSEDDIEYEYQVIILKVTGHTSFSEARVNGPPEECYPAEGDLCLEEICSLHGGPWYKCAAGNFLWDDIVTGAEREAVEMAVDEEIKNSTEYNCPEPDYYDYDDGFEF